MKTHVERATELKGIISKKRILKELGSKLEKIVPITKKGITHFIFIDVDDMGNVSAADYDPVTQEIISQEYDDLGPF